MANLLLDFVNWRCKVAKCKFPIAIIKSHYRTGKKSGCDARGRIEIIFQGRKMIVCKTHSQFDGRDNAY